MGRIWSEAGAIRAMQQNGFLNCFSTVKGRYFVISSIPLSREGSRLRYSIGCSMMLQRKLELVTGDSFSAAYRLKPNALARHSESRGRRSGAVAKS